MACSWRAADQVRDTLQDRERKWEADADAAAAEPAVRDREARAWPKERLRWEERKEVTPPERGEVGERLTRAAELALVDLIGGPEHGRRDVSEVLQAADLVDAVTGRVARGGSGHGQVADPRGGEELLARLRCRRVAGTGTGVRRWEQLRERRRVVALGAMGEEKGLPASGVEEEGSPAGGLEEEECSPSGGWRRRRLADRR